MSDNAAGQPMLDIRWLGALFALWLLLVALATLEATRDVAVALAWLIAVSAIIYALDPNGLNTLGRIGLAGR